MTEPESPVLESLRWLQTRALSFVLEFNPQRIFDGDTAGVQDVAPFDTEWLSREQYELAIATQNYISATVRPSWAGDLLTVRGTDLSELLLVCVQHCIRDRMETERIWADAQAARDAPPP